MRFRAGLIVALVGCGSSPEPVTPPEPQRVAAQALAPAADDAAMPGRPTLETVAGKGEHRRRGYNGWKDEFEGGPATAAELSRPHFAMADAAGAIYVADKDADAVRVIAADGTITTVLDGLSRPNGLWVKPDGTLYILDLGTSRILRRAPDGTLDTLFEVKRGISIGRGLWVRDDEQLVYVASGSRVLSWTPGAGVDTIASGFRSLGNLVVDPNGHLVVTDRVAGRVYRLDAAGNKQLIAELPGVRAVWFDDNGGMFLGAHEGLSVVYIDADGARKVLLENPDVDEVRGLSLDTDGNLIIADDDRGFIRRLRFGAARR